MQNKKYNFKIFKFIEMQFMKLQKKNNLTSYLRALKFLLTCVLGVKKLKLSFSL